MNITFWKIFHENAIVLNHFGVQWAVNIRISTLMNYKQCWCFVMTQCFTGKICISIKIAEVWFLNLRISWKSYLRFLMFFDFSRRFLRSFRSLHSLRVASSSAPATPKGDPDLRYRLHSPPFITLPTFASKSLFKIKKIRNLKAFSWDSQGSKIKFRNLIYKTSSLKCVWIKLGGG